jgi:hypothetical protein
MGRYGWIQAREKWREEDRRSAAGPQSSSSAKPWSKPGVLNVSSLEAFLVFPVVAV